MLPNYVNSAVFVLWTAKFACSTHFAVYMYCIGPKDLFDLLSTIYTFELNSVGCLLELIFFKKLFN